MATVALARGDTMHRAVISGGGGRHFEAVGWVTPILNAEGFLEDPLRVLTHPSFDQEEGVGIYEYAFNPHITRNFARSPVRKVDFAIERTLTSSVLIQSPQLDEDIVITEIWVGESGESQLSTLSDMYLTFLDFWNTLPAIGESLTWEPRDLSEESYGVQIVNVQLGSAADHEFREYRTDLSTIEGAYLARTLILQMKIVRQVEPPKGVISLVGA
jgi:hypothetical protein